VKIIIPENNKTDIQSMGPCKNRSKTSKISSAKR